MQAYEFRTTIKDRTITIPEFVLPSPGQNVRVIILADQPEMKTSVSKWKQLKGKYSGKLSSLNDFMNSKQNEKYLEL